MKKSLVLILFASLLIFSFIGCNKNQNSNQNQAQNQSQTANTPEQAVSDFLTAMQHEKYSGATKYYKENLDNMANFRNQVETISPAIANKLFSKLADFTYTIEESVSSQEDSSKATVYVTMDYYDVGQAFETALLDYIKNDISMTYDGKTSDDIIKKADETVTETINSSKKTTINRVPILLTLDDDTWKVEKMSQNTELLNVLTGNILETINKVTASTQNSN